MAPPKYWTTPEVAKMVNVRHMSLVRWMYLKKIPHPAFKIGKSPRFLWTEEEIERLREWVRATFYLHGTRLVRRGKRRSQ